MWCCSRRASNDAILAQSRNGILLQKFGQNLVRMLAQGRDIAIGFDGGFGQADGITLHRHGPQLGMLDMNDLAPVFHLWVIHHIGHGCQAGAGNFSGHQLLIQPFLVVAHEPSRHGFIHQIGVGKLQFGVSDALTETELRQFRSALVRNKQRQGLFSDQPVLVNFLGPHLFRARVGFPSNVPTGTYTVTVYLIRSGKVIGAQTIPLAVSKIGIGARIYDFAHQNSAAYGIVAILLALFAGWLGSAIFRKA